jgi:uncharacterized protein (TIGR02145 family)/prepilin-type N-terminal cleavage/methylation domain-containing protein
MNLHGRKLAPLRQGFAGQAFTLIELLVVIAIIGILATVSIVALNNARAKSRDAKRVADVKNIQTALALYYNDKKEYPITLTAGQPLFSTSLDGDGNVVTSTYMSIIPSAPTPADGANCNTTNNAFTYSTSSDLQSYVLSTCVSSPPQTQSSSTGPAIYISDPAQTQPCGAYVVNYEGKTYRTVQIGTQCWLRDNLNVGTKTTEGDSTACPVGAAAAANCISTGAPWCFCQVDDSKIEKNCPGGTEAGCTTYGGRYEWSEAFNLSAYYATNTYTFPSGNIRGICPPGWHIPRGSEYGTLERYLYGTADLCGTSNPGANYCFGRCTPANNTNGGLRDMLYPPGACSGRTPCGTSGFDYKSPSDYYEAIYGVDYGRVFQGNGYCNGVGGYGLGWKQYNYGVRCIKD